MKIGRLPQLIGGACIGTIALLAIVAPSHVRAADDAEAFFASLRPLSSAEREAKLLAGAKKEGSVVWYTTDGPQPTQQILRAFAKKYPGVKPEFIRGKSREIADRITSEARAGRDFFDLAKTSTETFNMYQDTIFARYDSPTKEEIPNSMKDEKWASLFTFVRALGYNSKLVKSADLPRTWEALLDPKWKGKILFDESSLAEVGALYARWGRDRTADYLEKLGASGNLQVRTGRTTMSQMLAAGEAPLAVTVYPYDIENLKSKGAPVEWDLLDHNPGLMQPTSISRKPAHPHAAALLYDYLMSKEGQEVYAAMGRTPANPNAAVKNEREKHAVQDPRVVFEELTVGGAPEDSTRLLDEKILRRSFTR